MTIAFAQVPILEIEKTDQDWSFPIVYMLFLAYHK